MRLAMRWRLRLSAFGVAVGMVARPGRLARLSVATSLVLVPDLAAKLLYILIPLSFAFAIFKYRLMNIDVIIRRTVLYSMLSGVIFVLYGVLVAGVGAVFVKFFVLLSQIMRGPSTPVVAPAAVPPRHRLS